MDAVLRKIQIAVVEFQRWGRMNGSGGDALVALGSNKDGVVELCTDGSIVSGSSVVGGGGVIVIERDDGFPGLRCPLGLVMLS